MPRRTSKPKSIDYAIHELVHQGKHDIPNLADEVGWSESSLYRASNPHDDGASFPVKRLTGAMIAQHDFGPLEHIAGRCGFALFKVPARVGRMQPDEMADLQKAQAEAVHVLHKFMAGEIGEDGARKAIDAAVGHLARARRAVDHGIRQGELEI